MMSVHLYDLADPIKEEEEIPSFPNSRIVFVATIAMSKKDDIPTRNIFKSVASKYLWIRIHSKSSAEAVSDELKQNCRRIDIIKSFLVLTCVDLNFLY